MEKWLQLTVREDSDSFEHTDGMWSYPDKNTIILWHKNMGYHVTNCKLTKKIISMLESNELGQIYPPSFPDTKKNYMFVLVTDLLNAVKEPTFLLQPNYPCDYKPAPKETYITMLPEFGDF